MSCTSWTGRHCYEGRYDEIPMEVDREIIHSIATMEDSEHARAFMLRRVYVRDICRYCGDIIDRDGR